MGRLQVIGLGSGTGVGIWDWDEWGDLDGLLSQHLRYTRPRGRRKRQETSRRHRHRLQSK